MAKWSVFHHCHHVVILLLLSFRQHVVKAFPNGAGGCASGNPLGGFHLAREQTTGSLAAGGFEMLLNGKPLLPTGVGTFPQSGGSSVLSLRATNENADFRGYLIRVDYGNGEGLLMADINGQQATVCDAEGVAGVTHTENGVKTSATAEMLVDDILTGPVSLEVTVVVHNSGEFQSVWYFSSYTLQQVARPPNDFPFAFFAFDGYQEPPFHELYENLLGAELFKRCVKRENPPAEGEICRGKPKACMFGRQSCPGSTGGQLQPTQRCNCKDEKWSCQPFACPTIGPVCPPLSPDFLTPAIICSSDLNCPIFEQRCCGTFIPAQDCSCQTGTSFVCKPIICPSDCSTLQLP